MWPGVSKRAPALSKTRAGQRARAEGLDRAFSLPPSTRPLASRVRFSGNHHRENTKGNHAADPYLQRHPEAPCSTRAAAGNLAHPLVDVAAGRAKAFPPPRHRLVGSDEPQPGADAA